MIRPELRDALRAFAAQVNQLAASGQLPAALLQQSYQLMTALDLPDNEAPLPIMVVRAAPEPMDT